MHTLDPSVPRDGRVAFGHHEALSVEQQNGRIFGIAPDAEDGREVGRLFVALEAQQTRQIRYCELK